MKYIVYTDGGSRGNPGISGCGIYITDDQNQPIEKRHKSLWIATNNVAEYTGAFLGISRAIELWATEIELRADSKLVVEQLSGNYKVKNLELKKIYQSIGDAVAKWGGKIQYTHIYREYNLEADRLSNVAMDSFRE